MLFIGIPTYKLTAEDEKKVRNRIDRAKIRLMTRRGTTFFSALLANLKLEINRDKPTAATNAVSLWMNPDMVWNLDEEEVLGVMLHEVMHVSAEHCDFERYKDYNQYVLGLAMDHWINNLILDMGYKLPDWVVRDKKYRDWPTMKIYHDLMKNPPPEPPDWQPDVIGKPSDMTQEQYENRVQSNIMKAAIQAEMADDAGSIPGNIKIKIKELVSPQLPWNLILYKFMDQYCKDDYSWQMPNRRFLRQGFYFPSMRSEKLSGVVSGIDVSGSMMDEIDEVMSENRFIKTLVQPQWFHLMTWDVQVHHDKVYEEYEDLPYEQLPDGGAGGTIIEPLIKLIVDKKPRFALIFTDGYFSDPNMDKVESDVYWVITKKGKKDFKAPGGVGEVIHMN